MEETRILEVAHSIPGRLRLRWRSEGEPPPELIADLEKERGIEQVEYRAPTRSLVLHHSPVLDLDDLQRAAYPFGVVVVDAAAGAAKSEEPPASGARWEWVMADLEAAVTLGLMFTWLRDLVLRRTLRFSTVLLVLLTALSLYQFWQRRRQRAAPAETEPAPLELLSQ
jgi:hypothetical protein